MPNKEHTTHDDSSAPLYAQHEDQSTKVKEPVTSIDPDPLAVRKASVSFVTIIELPINGYLSIDRRPLYFGQRVQKKELAKLVFTPTNGIKSNYYGNFKFKTHFVGNTTKEHNFLLDVDLINNTLDLENSAQVEESVKKENLAFKSKRKSDFKIENTDNNWLDATSLDLFED